MFLNPHVVPWNRACSFKAAVRAGHVVEPMHVSSEQSGDVAIVVPTRQSLSALRGLDGLRNLPRSG